MPIAPLIEPYQSDAVQLLALCIWREARGESVEGKRGVAWTILNRCMMAPAQGFKGSIRENILKPWAFSSFMEGDPNATKYPDPTDLSWHDSLAVAQAYGSDPTNDGVFYFSPPLTHPPAAWGTVEPTAIIGKLQFFKPA